MATISLPNKARIASYDVDSQNAFTPVCPDELPAPDGAGIVDELNAQAKFAGFRIASKDAHSPRAVWVARTADDVLTPVEGENVDVRWPVHAVPGTKGFELIEGLPKVTDYDFFIWTGVELDMHPYGNCYHDFAEKLSTGLIEFLHAKKVEVVIMGGLVTDYCVKTTALQLLSAGFAVIVNLGACRGMAEDTTQKAIEEMQVAGAQIIQSSKELEA